MIGFRFADERGGVVARVDDDESHPPGTRHNADRAETRLGPVDDRGGVDVPRADEIQLGERRRVRLELDERDIGPAKVLETVRKGMGASSKPLKRAEVVGWLPSEGVMAVVVYPES